MNKGEYDKLPEFIEPVVEPEEVVKEKVSITNTEKTKEIFGEQLTNVEKPLQVFLDEFGITEKELRNITKSYKLGDVVNTTQRMKNKKEFGEKSAEELKNLSSVETSNLHTAEALVKKFKFVVESVKANPKTWYLKKK